MSSYDPNYGVVTETDQYGYGANGTPGGLARKTQIAYASLGNIKDHPASITVTDGSGNLLSKTSYGYDEFSLQTPSGTTPQHVSVTSSRGNTTTVTSTVIGSNTLSRHFHYFDTGRVYQAVDVNDVNGSATTTYNYPDATSTCGNTFPTSVTSPISGLSSSMTWNCAGGVVASATDANQNQTTTSYTDPNFWRPAQIVAPYTSTATTTTTFSYTPYNSGVFASADSQMLFNNGTSVVERLATVNQFGQPVYSQQHEGPGTSYSWDSNQVLYDTFLRGNQGSMPCVSTTTAFTAQNQACPSAATTTRTFDALNRVTQTTDGGGGTVQYTYTQNDVETQVGPVVSGESLKTKQLEYDALGRLISVCEVTQSGPGPCGQTNALNGYFTTYSYSVVAGYPTTTVTQGPADSQQQRVYTYDLLGRMVSEQNPENGTVNYTYDSDSSGVCSGTYKGDLVKFVDAKGNIACYQYDVLHRLTNITYPSSGPDAANTPSKTFVFDNATFNGSAMTNPKGRLVEAYTGSSGSKITDEFFQYSVRGELTDTWECTPHSGTNGCASVSNYYHVTTGFWENGALKSLSSNISGLPSQTYGVDSMGRTNSVTASSGQSPVPVGPNSVVYDLVHFKTTVTFGSGDSDTFLFDSATGRQTEYDFSVNGAIDKGQTTWNPNGSLQSFNITDSVPTTSDTQNCSFTHDDLARISSVNCTNGSTNKWNQQFSYDAFGNLQKNSSGPGTIFQPQYSSSTNWITALPGTTPTTDANGQMTYDGAHSYTWDAEGKLHSVDTTTLTHDALGRMVERVSGSEYKQFVYGPQGRFAMMNGQTLVMAYIPLPTGATAVYRSSGLAYYRHSDHLGSSRLASTPSRGLYSSTAYAPYGEPYAQSGTTDLSFTGQGTDTLYVGTNGTTPAMYDFLVRKYSPTQGRWLSPDPMGVGAVDPSNPQTWNRYAYVMNNPLALIDPLGDEGYEGCGSGFTQGCGSNLAYWGMLADPFVYTSIPVSVEVCENGDCDWNHYYLPWDDSAAQAAVQLAITDAMRALSKPKCAALIDEGTGIAAEFLGGGSSPEDMAAAGLSGNRLLGSASMQTGDLGSYQQGSTPNTVTSTAAIVQGSVLPAVNGVSGGCCGPPYTVTFNSNPSGAFMSPRGFLGLTASQNRALAVLHEVGHLIAAYYGPFSTAIAPDGDFGGGTASSLANSQAIARACF